MDKSPNLLEKSKTYTLKEIESFDLSLTKKSYLGRFYRKDNMLYVFEQLSESPDKYLLKAIFED